jgi:tetratricopeptide (TPR) repeat protein
MRLLPLLFLFFLFHCSPVSRSSLERPKLENGFEYYSASVDSMNKGAYVSALDLVKEAIKLNPNYAKFYLLEGDLYTELSNPQEALNSYLKATKLRSSYVEVFIRIATIYEKEYKNYDEAIKYYRRSYAVDKSNHNLLINIGECYLSSGEITLAKHKAEEYKKLIESENKLLNFDYFYLNAKISYLQKDYAAAKSDLERAIKLNPRHFDAKLLLVKCLFETDNPEEGLKYTNELMKLNDTVGEVYYFRALYYFSRNKFKDSLGLFEQALALDGSLLKSHYYLGKIYESLGDKEKSLKHLQLFRQSMNQENNIIELQ